MKAGVATEQGLAVRDIAQPRPKPNEVLVKVKAAALNRADLATARGIPHGSHGGIGAAVGLEWAGGEFRCGDALLFQSLCVHRGTHNLTPDRVRLSVDYRYQPASQPVVRP